MPISNGSASHCETFGDLRGCAAVTLLAMKGVKAYTAKPVTAVNDHCKILEISTLDASALRPLGYCAPATDALLSLLLLMRP